MLATLGTIIQLFVSIYTFILLVRLVVDWVQFFSPQWRPNGTVMLTFLNVIYKVTDPPLRFLRKFVPPLRLGEVSLDLGFMLLFIGVILLGQFARFLM